MVILDIPITPKGKARHRISKSGGMYSPSSEYENELGWLVKDALMKQRQPKGEKRSLEGPVAVVAVFKMPIPKSTSKKNIKEMLRLGIKHIKKPDSDNCLKAVCDALNKIAWNDDSQLYMQLAFKMYAEQPGILLFLSRDWLELLKEFMKYMEDYLTKQELKT